MTARRARATMGGVSHVHREDPRNVFGEMFRRGPAESADGGDRVELPRSTMATVDHEDEDGDVNRVWARGDDVGADER